MYKTNGTKLDLLKKLSNEIDIMNRYRFTKGIDFNLNMKLNKRINNYKNECAFILYLIKNPTK